MDTNAVTNSHEGRYREYRRDLAENARDDDPVLFGQYLGKLCKAAEPELPPIDLLIKIKIASPKAVGSWLSGKLNTRGHELTVKKMIALLRLFCVEYPILTTEELIKRFVCMASSQLWAKLQTSPEYRHLIEFLEMMTQIGSQSEDRYPRIASTYTVQRVCFTKVCDYIKSGRYKIILVTGIEGSGKTTLLEFLQNDPDIRRIFGDRILYASFRDHQGQLDLRRWWSELSGEPFDSHRKFETIKREIREELAKQKYLVLYDDLVDFIPFAKNDYLELADTDAGSIYVVTTLPPKYDVRLQLPPRLVEINIDKVSQNEVEELYSIFTGTYRGAAQNEELEHLLRIAELVDWNIAALVMCLLMERNLSDIRAQFEELVVSPHDPISPVYWPLEIAYRNLSPEVRDFFEKLSSLPICREYNEDSIAVAVYQNKKERKAALRHLEKLSRFMSISIDDSGKICISRYVLKYSKMLRAKRVAQYDEEKEMERFLTLSVAQGLHRSNFGLVGDAWRGNLREFMNKVKNRNREFKQSPKTLLKRTVSWLLIPNYVTEWETVKHFSPRFAVVDVIFAYANSRRKPVYRALYLLAILLTGLSMFVRPLIVIGVLLGFITFYLFYRDEAIWNLIFSRASNTS